MQTAEVPDEVQMPTSTIGWKKLKYGTHAAS